MQKKLRVVMVIPAVLLVILSLTNDKYYWLRNIAFILISLNLIIMGIQAFKENKKSLFAYCITSMAILLFFLSLKELLS